MKKVTGSLYVPSESEKYLMNSSMTEGIEVELKDTFVDKPSEVTGVL